VNGEVAQNIAQRITKDDRIELRLRSGLKKVAYALHKPVGLLSSPNGDEDWAANWIPNNECWNIGRLDRDSSGLLICTNEGWLSGYVITQHVTKTYRVATAGVMNDLQLTRLARGVNVQGVRTLPCRIDRLSPNTFTIALNEGRNRQIRRMVRTIQGEVTELHRVKIGNLTLPENVKPGYFKRLTREEIEMAVGVKLPVAVAAEFEDVPLSPWEASHEIKKVPELADAHNESKSKKSYYERRKEALTWQKLQKAKEDRQEAKVERRNQRVALKAKK
jgi:pseudouridine synthase